MTGNSYVTLYKYVGMPDGSGVNFPSEYTDGAGVKSTYTYSPANEVLSIASSQDGSLLSSATYGPDGPLNYNLGDGTRDSFGYDSLGRLSSGGSSGSRSPVYEFSATWQGNQVKTAWDTVLTGLGEQITYGYDEFGRLTSQHSPNSNWLPSLSWVYDRYGNRWQQNVTAGTGPQAQLSFNVSNNEITSAGYSYDAAGNLLSDGQHSYTYDADGNITAVDGGATATYTYDALNHRVETNVDGARTEFVYNAAGQRVSEWNGNNRAENEGNYYWGSRPLAFYTTTPDNDGYTLFFEHQDWEGTERARTDASSYANSSPDATFYSLPYGDAQAQVEDQDGVGDLDPNHYGMLDSDMETGTDHAQFRQYSPATGRWMRPDPYSGSYDMANPQSMNRYVYAMNSPLSNIDPSGLDCIYDEDGSYVANEGDCGSDSDSGYYVDCDGCTNGVTIIGVSADSNGNLTGYSGYSSTSPGGIYDPNGNLIAASPTASDTVTASMPSLSTSPVDSTAYISVQPNSMLSMSVTAHTAVIGSVDIPVGPGAIVVVSLAKILAPGKTCAGLGVGTGTLGVSGGVVHSSANIQNVLSGGSVSVAAQNGVVGGQTVQNSSGIAVGNSAGTPGASLTVSYSICF